DLGLLNLVMPLEPEALYLVLQELMDAVPNRLHRLASAGNAQGALGTGNQQMLGNRPGLDATTAAVQDLVAMRLREKPDLLGKYDLQSLGLTYSTLRPVLASRPSPSPSGLARSNTSLAAARAPLRSLSLRFMAYSRTPRAGSTIARSRACAAALTWGAAP